MGAASPMFRLGSMSLRVLIGGAALSLALVLAPSGFAQTQSPDVTRIIDPARAPEARVIDVPARTLRRAVHTRRLHQYRLVLGVQRPVLAGVRLVTPLAPPVKAPDTRVVAPAYVFDSVFADLTTPPPPIVCQRRPRDPDLPGPRSYREVPLACHYDID